MQVLTMGYEEAEFESSINPKPDDIFTIAYTGTLTPLYAGEYFLKTFSSLVGKHPHRKLKLKLAGTIYEHFFEEVKRLGIEKNVEYLGYLPHASSIDLIKQSDALLLINPRSANNRRIVPGKIYEYLAAQKPIISISDSQSENENIIAACRAGKNFDWQQMDKLLIYLQDLLTGDSPICTSVLKNHESIKKYGRKTEAKNLLCTLNKKIFEA